MDQELQQSFAREIYEWVMETLPDGTGGIIRHFAWPLPSGTLTATTSLVLWMCPMPVRLRSVKVYLDTAPSSPFVIDIRRRPFNPSTQTYGAYASLFGTTKPSVASGALVGGLNAQWVQREIRGDDILALDLVSGGTGPGIVSLRMEPLRI